MSRQKRYATVIDSLRRAYDRAADERDKLSRQPWKLEERANFLALIHLEGKRRLLEIGAGTGADGLFFQRGGLDVTCIDLSAENVRRCREKGLKAHVRDLFEMDFEAGTFDAVYAFNCLLHVPRAKFPAALEAINTVLAPGGFFFLGQYGGQDREGVRQEDHYEPKRFYSFLSDEAMEQEALQLFEIVSFEHRSVSRAEDLHFQALTLRKL